jgi:predicted  nucleic acid-binding Zn-ribbon protein
MWKQFFELFRQVLTVTEDTQRNRAEIKELREQVQALSLTVQRLVAEIERVRSEDKHEREKLVLQLDNALLRFERRLPPIRSEGDARSGE